MLNLSLIKISVLVFYLRIFPYDRFRQWTWAIITFVVLSTIASVALTIFQCTPVSRFWDRDLDGKCLNFEAAAYIAAGLTIASDFMTVLLPIPVVRRLSMSWKRKVGVIVMFTLGSIGCLISVVRLHSLVYYGDSLDPTGKHF